MKKIFKILMPITIVGGLAVAGGIYLDRAGKSGQAGRAAHAVIDAADQALESARAEARFRENDEENFVNLGAIFTSNGTVVATLIVRGTKGAAAVCNNMAFVRDYLVGLMSDFPPDARNLSGGPVGYGGSVVDGMNKLIRYDAITRIRYDSYHLGQTGGTPNC